ncbi:unnamed protein product [Heligmosomoides polygyrus]|uniref:Uncharacterized protein n=1 Tax=Heligmosomoides polygyrus TaxID=6339 RepID=A0A183G469_HELPZ|nr:unnamed protein product [Heligmosomoides polygyrus]
MNPTLSGPKLSLGTQFKGRENSGKYADLFYVPGDSESVPNTSPKVPGDSEYMTNTLYVPMDSEDVPHAALRKCSIEGDQ